MTIAKNQNTYAKRAREAAKKAKAEAKRVRRMERRNGTTSSPAEHNFGDESESTDESE